MLPNGFPRLRMQGLLDFSPIHGVAGNAAVHGLSLGEVAIQQRIAQLCPVCPRTARVERCHRPAAALPGVSSRLNAAAGERRHQYLYRDTRISGVVFWRGLKLRVSPHLEF